MVSANVSKRLQLTMCVLDGSGGVCGRTGVSGEVGEAMTDNGICAVLRTLDWRAE